MDQFFVLDFKGGPFVLLSPSHLVAIGALIALNLFIFFYRKPLKGSGGQIMRILMAALLVLNELTWHVWNLYHAQWNIQTMLPLHLCSVLVWACAYMLVTKNRAIYEFAYLLGIASALQAYLTPDLGIYDFPHFRYFQVFVSHGLIITSALYMTFVEGFRPYPDSPRKVLLYGNVYLVIVTALNFAIGSNYLFTAHKPPTASILDVLPPWPWYIAIIELLGFFFVMLFYLPFWIKDLRQKSRMPA